MLPPLERATKARRLTSQNTQTPRIERTKTHWPEISSRVGVLVIESSIMVEWSIEVTLELAVILPLGEKRRRSSNDKHDNDKRCPGNHSKTGWMDKSGEAEEEDKGQGGWETRYAFAFFFVTHHNTPSYSVHACVMSLTTTTNAQTTTPRSMYSNHETVKWSNAIFV